MHFYMIADSVSQIGNWLHEQLYIRCIGLQHTMYMYPNMNTTTIKVYMLVCSHN